MQDARKDVRPTDVNVVKSDAARTVLFLAESSTALVTIGAYLADRCRASDMSFQVVVAPQGTPQAQEDIARFMSHAPSIVIATRGVSNIAVTAAQLCAEDKEAAEICGVVMIDPNFDSHSLYRARNFPQVDTVILHPLGTDKAAKDRVELSAEFATVAGPHVAIHGMETFEKAVNQDFLQQLWTIVETMRAPRQSPLKKPIDSPKGP